MAHPGTRPFVGAMVSAVLPPLYHCHLCRSPPSSSQRGKHRNGQPAAPSREVTRTRVLLSTTLTVTSSLPYFVPRSSALVSSSRPTWPRWLSSTNSDPRSCAPSFLRWPQAHRVPRVAITPASMVKESLSAPSNRVGRPCPVPSLSVNHIGASLRPVVGIRTARISAAVPSVVPSACTASNQEQPSVLVNVQGRLVLHRSSLVNSGDSFTSLTVMTVTNDLDSTACQTGP